MTLYYCHLPKQAMDYQIGRRGRVQWMEEGWKVHR